MERERTSRLSRAAAASIRLDATSSGTHVLTLPSGIHDKKTLFTAMREVMPLDPPLSGVRDVWDALQDSLWSGLHSLSKPELLIVWPNASEMLRVSPADFEIAAAMLEEVARSLDDPAVTRGRVTKVAVVLEGVWE